MKINFEYIENSGYDHALFLKAYKVEILIGFKGLDAQMVTLNQQHDFEVGDDALFGLSVDLAANCLEPILVPLQAIVETANNVIEDYVREHEAEQEAEANMEGELSSPHLTGRV